MCYSIKGKVSKDLYPSKKPLVSFAKGRKAEKQKGKIMEKHMTDERTGISYTLQGDYYYPDLRLPPRENEENIEIGKYGRMHLDFIKKHRRGTYTGLLCRGALGQYLSEVNTQASEEVSKITVQLAASRRINEAMKASDQLRWVQEMNNCKAAAEEKVLKEIIFM